MNTVTINITGQLTIDPKNLEQLFSDLQIRNEDPTPPKPMQTALPRLAYTVEETARMLSVSEKTVYRLIERGLLKSSGALRHKRIAHTEIERFLKATTEKLKI